MKKKIIFFIFIALLVIAGGVGWWYYSSHRTEKNNDYTLGTVQKGNLQLSVDATGTIEPVNQVDLSATASGTLEHVFVKQNEPVTKGEVLAEIESKALTSTREQTQNTLTNKESYYNRMNKLYGEGAVSYQTMDDARLEYLNAKAAYDKAEADLDDTVIVAPMDGIVIGEPMNEGETVSQGLSNQMVIISIADLSDMRIELLVDETDIGAVKIGQKVEFTVDAYPNKVFHGIIQDISKKEYSSSSSSTSSSSTSSSVVYYTVYVSINRDELEGLYPSMTARATIYGRESRDTLIVPVTAIRSDAAGTYVYAKTGNNIEKVYVKTGITTDKEIEILTGLKEGDQIVVSGMISSEKTAKPVTKNPPRPPRL